MVDPLSDCGGASSPNDTTLDPDYGCPDTLELFRCCIGRTMLSYNGQPTARGGNELRPDLATALPDVSSNGLTWTFHLRPQLHYGPPLQNTEIVSADFVRALQRTARVSQAPPTYYSIIVGFDDYAGGKTASISGLETPDAHTLIVRLTQPAGDLGYRFSVNYAAPIPPLHRDPGAPFGVETGHDSGIGGFLVSSGPYMLEGSQALDFDAPAAQQRPPAGFSAARKSITLVRNPSWTASSDDLRAALADRIVIDFSLDEPAAAAAIDSGRADVQLSNNPPPQAPIDQVHAYQGDVRKGHVEIRSHGGVRYVSMNLAVPPFDDLHVRRAVAYAVDRAAMVDAFGGPVSGTLTGHIALDSLEDDALVDFDPYHAGDAATRLRLARGEMAQSSYDSTHAGRCDARVCSHVAALVKAGQNAPTAFGDIVRNSVAQLGIQLDLQNVAGAPFFHQAGDPASRTPMVVGWAWNQDYPNAADFFTSPMTHDGLAAQANFSLLGARPSELKQWGYTVASVPSVDDRIQHCLPLVGSAQAQCWTALDQYVMEKLVPVVPILSENYVEVVPARVTSYSFDAALDLPALDRIAVAG